MALMNALLAALILLAAAVPLRAADNDDDSNQAQMDRAQKKMMDDFNKAEKTQADEFSKMSDETAAQYREFERQRARQAAEFRAAVARQWTEFHEPSAKEWVSYSGKRDALGRVDFEKGKIRVEVLVPADQAAPDRTKAAAEKIRERVKELLAQKDGSGARVLQDQVKTSEGKPVTPENADEFVKTDVARTMVVEPKPVVAQDGKPRLKVVVEVPLVPDHEKVRAQRYKPIVARWAAQYDLAPELIFAVIQTESDFNPLSQSNAGAVGLMQVVPRTAGDEAYRYLYKEDKALTSDYLLDPENNIKLGATYLHMLDSLHYGKVKDADNRRTLSIAAYNCGPGNVHTDVL